MTQNTSCKLDSQVLEHLGNNYCVMSQSYGVGGKTNPNLGIVRHQSSCTWKVILEESSRTGSGDSGFFSLYLL